MVAIEYAATMIQEKLTDGSSDFGRNRWSVLISQKMRTGDNFIFILGKF